MFIDHSKLLFDNKGLPRQAMKTSNKNEYSPNPKSEFYNAVTPPNIGSALNFESKNHNQEGVLDCRLLIFDDS